MQPFYFGSSQKQLFGAYHAPEGKASRQAGVVLCHPLGHEYLRAHRAFRNLAASLASQGLHVLRFDYYGCGDSGGDDGGTTPEQCLADVASAIEELKDTAGVAKVSLIGLRMGATFAALTAARRRDVDRLVLWDPVCDGRSYIDELQRLQGAWLHDRLGLALDSGAYDAELIGYPLTPLVREQLESMTLSAAARPQSKAVTLVISESRPSYQTLLTELEGSKTPVACTLIQEPGDWTNGDLVHQILLPHMMVKTIVSLMAS